MEIHDAVIDNNSKKWKKEHILAKGDCLKVYPVIIGG